MVARGHGVFVSGDILRDWEGLEGYVKTGGARGSGQVGGRECFCSHVGGQGVSWEQRPWGLGRGVQAQVLGARGQETGPWVGSLIWDETGTSQVWGEGTC